MSKLKKKTDPAARLGGRIWFNLCLFGFTGQVAWNLENMYYNTFMYNTVYEGGKVTGTLSSMDAIQWMVALSAVTAVLTTFIMGNLSDKMNRRKVFISVGYVIWGVITAAFGLLTKDNIGGLLHLSDQAKVVTATAVAIIAMDCLMTFVGSTANDSAFNAWVTDITTPKNRATAESVLAILPVVALVVVVLFGGSVATIGYANFFYALGGFVILCGVIGLFSLKDSRSGERSANSHYWADLVYGFRPSVIKQNSKLYIALAAVCFYSIAVQVFFPYLLIYLDHGLGFKVEDLLGYLSPAVIGIAALCIVVAIGAIIAFGKLADKIGKKNLVFIACGCFIVGLFAAGFQTRLGAFALAAIPLFAGYGMLGIMLNATVRDYTPTDKVGLFQGIRMIFFVLIPMVVGPKIGGWACEIAASGTYVDEATGLTSAEPCKEMFLAAGIIAVLVLIPVIVLRIKGIDKVDAPAEETAA